MRWKDGQGRTIYGGLFPNLNIRAFPAFVGGPQGHYLGTRASELPPLLAPPGEWRPQRFFDEETRAKLQQKLTFYLRTFSTKSSALSCSFVEAAVSELARLEKDIWISDIELAVCCSQALGRALMWARRYVEAVQKLLWAIRMRSCYALMNDILLCDFAVACSLTKDPFALRVAYCSLVLAGFLSDAKCPSNIAVVDNYKRVCNFLAEGETLPVYAAGSAEARRLREILEAPRGNFGAGQS